MRYLTVILFTLFSVYGTAAISLPEAGRLEVDFNFCGTPIRFEAERSVVVNFEGPLNAESIRSFYNALNAGDYQPVLDALLDYKRVHNTEDWLYYQLIRNTVQQISPKEKNYDQYTLYKWFFLIKSGYDAILTTSGNYILFYVRCNENTYNIPTRVTRGKQYVCLNYHDYKQIDPDYLRLSEIPLFFPEADKTFSYKIHRMPDFQPEDYREKDIRFSYYHQDFYFKLKINPRIQTLFKNYPVLDYEFYLNMPLSRETYQSLIPTLKKNIRGLNTVNGVDYLMRFTRYAFLFQTDTERFGEEKRFSPEQTLLYEKSDCEDRAALFFYLVKELYNLPMIVMAYPEHVTVAVRFKDKHPAGTPVWHNGALYSVCEPTPQRRDLPMGQLLPELRHQAFEVVYAYDPSSDQQ